MIKSPVLNQRVWFCVMARDSVMAGKITKIETLPDGRTLCTIKAPFSKLAMHRVSDYIFKTSKEAREFYSAWKSGKYVAATGEEEKVETPKLA